MTGWLSLLPVTVSDEGLLKPRCAGPSLASTPFPELVRDPDLQCPLPASSFPSAHDIQSADIVLNSCHRHSDLLQARRVTPVRSSFLKLGAWLRLLQLCSSSSQTPTWANSNPLFRGWGCRGGTWPTAEGNLRQSVLGALKKRKNIYPVYSSTLR